MFEAMMALMLLFVPSLQDSHFHFLICFLSASLVTLLQARAEIPFEFPLKANGGQKLYESYHGVFINISVSRYCLVLLMSGCLRFFKR